jgi:hypothetical protein
MADIFFKPAFALAAGIVSGSELDQAAGGQDHPEINVQSHPSGRYPASGASQSVVLQSRKGFSNLILHLLYEETGIRGLTDGAPDDHLIGAV